MTELIIFDLGRVLVDFDFKKVIRRLGTYTSKTEKDIRAYFSTTPLWDRFERGQIAPKPFFKKLKADLKLNKLEFDEFVPLWNTIFSEKRDTVSILRKLRKRYRLAMISNVNELHWKHIQKNHAFMTWFHYPVASYAVGYRKPDLEIYRLTLRRAGVAPARAVFIDDLAPHIQAAQSLGIRSHQFHNAPKLLSDLNGIL